MHKAQYNRARVELRIVPVGPMLIRAGKSSMDPTRPDLEWVRTQHALGGETVYLPGSSLKGVVRAQAERILHALDRRCDDPFKNKDRHDDKIRPATVFTNACAAARTFGSLEVGGRTRFSDAYPWPLDATVEIARKAAAALSQPRSRTGVAIDRKTGATKRGALYNLEVVEDGQFFTEISLVNFQLWQLQLLLYVLTDLDEGFVRVGSGKSRGLGRVRCNIDKLVLDWVCKETPIPQEIRGTGVLCPSTVAKQWGLVAPEHDRGMLSGPTVAAYRGLYARVTASSAEVEALEQALAPAWNAFREAPEMKGRAA